MGQARASVQPLIRFISLIADYGTGDPAFAEVKQRLLMVMSASSCLLPALSTSSFCKVGTTNR